MEHALKQNLAHIYYANAIKLLASERRKSRRIDEVYRVLVSHNVKAGIEDWLSNPFIKTAMQILKKFSGNYKIQQAMSLLNEAGEEAAAEAEKSSKKKKR